MNPAEEFKAAERQPMAQITSGLLAHDRKKRALRPCRCIDKSGEFSARGHNRTDYQRHFRPAKIFLMKNLAVTGMKMYLCAPIFPQP
jgi:hypothetical protein